MFGRPKSDEADRPMFNRNDHYGSYLVSSYRQDGIAIAELTPEEQETLEKDGNPHFARDFSIAGGSFSTNVGTICAAATVGMPAWAYFSAYGISWGATLGSAARFPVQNTLERRAQRNVARNISEDTARHMFFPKKDIEFKLPQEVLSQDVEFQSETGFTTATAGELTESVNNKLFGLDVKRQKLSKSLKVTVSPGEFMTSALYDVPRGDWGFFLASSMDSIQRMHTAMQNIPRYGSDTRGLPEGMHQLHERHLSNTFVGALGIYATLRSHISPSVARSINDLYASHGNVYQEDPLLADAARFDSPTAERLEWQEIVQARSYIRGIETNNIR